MAAAIIRTVLLLRAGPEGALVGSQWACRETFVAIVVSNVPIIQPFLATAANKTKLSTLFSKSAKSTESYELEGRSDGRVFKVSRKKGTHPLSLPQGTAWDSNEHILGECTTGASNVPPVDSNKILISSEFAVTTKQHGELA
ncbi:hypothetical protein MGN70_011428 [Eutypa lata]|nr:hypothetical protein MGN70_011428 [Eutypa lata]